MNKVHPITEKNIICEYELQSAQFNLQAKQAPLVQANTTQANARTNIGYTSVTSFVSKIVGTIPYKMGSLVSSNRVQPLTTISNVSNIYAYFPFMKKSVGFSKRTTGAGKQKLQQLQALSIFTGHWLGEGWRYKFEKAKQIQAHLICQVNICRKFYFIPL